MADPKSTVYDADPHTQAKHRILQEYLKRWAPILSNQSTRVSGSSDRLLYVDGFAGAGEYSANVPGSPLVAIQTIIEHSHDFPIPVRIKLIELRQDRVDHLRQLIKDREALIRGSNNLIVDDPIQGDCETIVSAIIEEHDQQRRALGPALFFLDQFGYSSVPMSLVKRIIEHKVCEVFSYLNWNMLCPYLSDPTKENGITRAFGGSEWKEVIGLTGQQREERFRQLYLTALRARAGACYAYPFAMRDRNHRVIYWLFFCSRSPKGLEEMKRAMWTVDPTGGFEFSDKHANQPGALFRYTEENLMGDLSQALDRRTMTVDEVRDYVLLNTPAYLYRSVLQKMERGGLVEVVGAPVHRRSGSFSSGEMKVRFERKASPKELLLFAV